MENEIWKPIPSCPGYEASSLGHIRRVQYVNQRLLGGYPTISASVNGKPVQRPVHQLVCEAFHGPRTGPVTRHLDGDSENNTPENLAWGTHSENSLDTVRHGRAKRVLGPRNWDRIVSEVNEFGEPFPGIDVTGGIN